VTGCGGAGGCWGLRTGGCGAGVVATLGGGPVTVVIWAKAGLVNAAQKINATTEQKTKKLDEGVVLIGLTPCLPRVPPWRFERTTRFYVLYPTIVGERKNIVSSAAIAENNCEFIKFLKLKVIK